MDAKNWTPGVDMGYTGMTQDQWDKLPSTDLSDIDLTGLPDVVPFKPQLQE